MQGRGREKEVHLISGDLRGSVYMDMMWPWRFDRSARILTQGQTGQVRGGWIREAEFGWPWQGGPGPVRSGLGWISRDEANPAMVGEAGLD